MTNIGKFYRTSDGSSPIIGNGVELIAKRKEPPGKGFHVLQRQPCAKSGFPDYVEKAIRYDEFSASVVAKTVIIGEPELTVSIACKPILFQEDGTD